MPPIAIIASIACILTTSLGAVEPGTISVKLGSTIQRSLDDVRAAGFAWGPKQDVDPATRETCVYLPYGGQFLNYHGAVRGLLGDAGPNTIPEFVSSSGGQGAGQLTYKLEFDRPIRAFRFAIGYAETVLDPACAAGLEYSSDGKAWAIAKEVKGQSMVVSPFPGPNTAVDGLDTTTLFLRLYARNTSDPSALTGSGMFLKLRLAGDPSWGDAATTFFTGQARVWLTTK